MNAAAFLASPETKLWVSEELRKLAPAAFNPENRPFKTQGRGVIAGGAPANLLIARWTGKPTPINDVDLFHINASFEGLPDFIQDIPDEASTGEFTTAQGDYDDLNEVQTEANYLILGTYREGVINHVLVNIPENRNSALRVIEPFDINVTMVAYDIDTDTLVWKPAFEEALNRRQIEVTNLHTPWRTAIRLIAKAQELPLYCNLPWELQILNQPYAIAAKELAALRVEHGWKIPQNPNEDPKQIRIEAENVEVRYVDTTQAYHELQWRFSEAYRSRVLKTWETLRQHYRLFNITPVRTAVGPDLTDMGFEREFKTTSKIEEVSNPADMTKGRFTLEPHNGEIIPLVEEIINSATEFDAGYALLASNLANQMVRRRKSEQQKVRLLLKHQRTAHLVLKNPSIARGDYCAEHVKQLDTFLTNHPRILPLFEEAGDVSFQTMYEAYRVLVTKARPSFIGRLETALLDIEIRQEKIAEVAKGKDGWAQEIAEHASLGSEPLATPMDLKGLSPLIRNLGEIQELYTAAMLEDEGATMHHCVGGYDKTVADGTSRIFSIVTPKGRSTCELKTRRASLFYRPTDEKKNEVWYIAQHRAFANGEPENLNDTIAQGLLRHLNQMEHADCELALKTG